MPRLDNEPQDKVIADKEIIEVSIDLELLNKKLNYIIEQLEQIKLR